MPGLSPTAKPPQTGESDDLLEDTGRLSHSELASWFGNALVLASIGTVPLVMEWNQRTKAIDALSIVLIMMSLAITLWASYKFYFVGSDKHRLHWTEWILFVILIVAIASFIWFATIVSYTK